MVMIVMGRIRSMEETTCERYIDDCRWCPFFGTCDDPIIVEGEEC